MQAEEEAQEGRPAAPRPGLIICNEPWGGHLVALQGALGHSCCRTDLIGKAAARSRTKGSLAKAGRTGRERIKKNNMVTKGERGWGRVN